VRAQKTEETSNTQLVVSEGWLGEPDYCCRGLGCAARADNHCPVTLVSRSCSYHTQKAPKSFPKSILRDDLSHIHRLRIRLYLHMHEQK
jgi:hypothetical protein